MKKIRVVVTALTVLAVAAGAAEYVTTGRPADPFRRYNSTGQPARGGAAPVASTSSLELYWDYPANNDLSDFCWYTGADTWAASDFDITTLSAYNYIYSSRIWYPFNWPNNVWEGNGMAVFAFSGGTPGSVIMPSRYVRGSGFINGWQVYSVGWSLGTTQEFCMAFSQLYDPPNCDPVYPFDFNNGYHSWYFNNGAWSRISSLGSSDFALMLRCTVSAAFPAVEPASLGRVKALFK